MLDNQSRQLFQDWYETELGQRLLNEEHDFVEQALDNMVGYYLVQQSPLRHLTFHNHRIRETISLSPVLELGASQRTVVARMSELPLESDGIDAVVLHHTLDLSENPHRDLHEVARTLLPSGKLIIIGFNPIGYWGVRRYFSKRVRAPWAARFISHRRLDDWLKVAGLTLENIEFIDYDMPLKSNNWRQRLDWIGRSTRALKLPLGGVYIMTATKQTRRYIPLKPRWKTAKVRVPPLTKPTIKEIK
ncbi:class I SAM-dependent methyltransferase [Marinomonas ostreistagni]|uniref:Methyltransferase domain-containing protein n=1 Tax=Marinomonas ostreistagni TaxID=359209 RepID=A0ABS0Z7I4_9GAMM|nr:methyltransferase domain-containing protein [Marinomonas ostreistagni]MBJ7549622.1 methyltransferase domain-containing protein [Marinomonas ostreistagni]